MNCSHYEGIFDPTPLVDNPDVELATLAGPVTCIFLKQPGYRTHLPK